MAAENQSKYMSLFFSSNFILLLLLARLNIQSQWQQRNAICLIFTIRVTVGEKELYFE